MNYHRWVSRALTGNSTVLYSDLRQCSHGAHGRSSGPNVCRTLALLPLVRTGTSLDTHSPPMIGRIQDVSRGSPGALSARPKAKDSCTLFQQAAEQTSLRSTRNGS